MVEQLADELFQYIKKSKYKFYNINDATDFLKDKLGESYTSEIGIAVKNTLLEHPKLIFFKEGTYIHDQKYHYCTGNWLSIREFYDNPVEAKEKLGWYAWQETEEIDWDND